LGKSRPVEGQGERWCRGRDSKLHPHTDKHSIDLDTCPSYCHPCPFQLNPELLEDEKFLRVLEGWKSLSEPLKEAILALTKAGSASGKAGSV
jgi:hypothetical protein